MNKIFLGDRTAAVIVSFYPPEDLLQRVVALAKQVGMIVVVDNTPGGVPSFRDFKNRRVRFIVNGENRGLAAAQNQGICFARECGFEWVLLLDQDSSPAGDFMAAMSNYYSGLSEAEKEKLLMLAPRIYDEVGRFFYKHVLPGPLGFVRRLCDGQDYLKGAFFSISSGSLIPLRNFLDLGLMDEDFFIDYVDDDFCLRGISRGKIIHVVCSALLFHRLGERKRSYRFGGIEIRPSFHSPMRRYFIYRNRVRVWKRYGKKVPGFLIFDLLAAVYDLLRIVFFEENSREKLQAALKGILHGARLQ